MKRETHISNQTETPSKRHRWRQYWKYAIIPTSVGAFAAYWTNTSDPQPVIITTEYEVISNPCGCETEMLIDSLGAPYYYDTPVKSQPYDDATGTSITQEKHEWLYVDPPPDTHSWEELASLRLKLIGGNAMGP